MPSRRQSTAECISRILLCPFLQSLQEVENSAVIVGTENALHGMVQHTGKMHCILVLEKSHMLLT